MIIGEFSVQLQTTSKDLYFKSEEDRNQPLKREKDIALQIKERVLEKNREGRDDV